MAAECTSSVCSTDMDDYPEQLLRDKHWVRAGLETTCRAVGSWRTWPPLSTVKWISLQNNTTNMGGHTVSKTRCLAQLLEITVLTFTFHIYSADKSNQTLYELTDNLSITSIVSGNREAVLNIDATPVAASWLPLWGLPALAGCVHDATGIIMGATGQALLQPLAQHLAGRHTWVPLPHDQKLSFELTDIILPLHDLQAVSWGHLADLQELLAGFQVGDSGWRITQPDHLVEALHTQVGARGLDEGVELEGPDLAGHTGVGGLGDFHVDGVAARIRVLQGPGAWCGGQGGRRGEHTKETTLFQGGTGGRGWAGGSAGGQTEEEQHEGHTGAGKSWPRHWVGLDRRCCCSCFCDCWFNQVVFDFFVASYCTCFRSFNFSMKPLCRIAGFADFSAADNLSCLYQRGSCRERGNKKRKHNLSVCSNI